MRKRVGEKKDDAKWNKNKSCLISSTEFRDAKERSWKNYNF